MKAQHGFVCGHLQSVVDNSTEQVLFCAGCSVVASPQDDGEALKIARPVFISLELALALVAELIYGGLF